MSRNPFIYLPLAGLLILGACTIESTGGAANATKVGFDPSLPASPDANAEDYGLDGTMGEADLLALSYLNWPQNYTSISDRFGFPAQRSESADYYSISGNRWVAIYYDSTGNATGYSISDSQ